VETLSEGDGGAAVGFAVCTVGVATFEGAA